MGYGNECSERNNREDNYVRVANHYDWIIEQIAIN